MRPLLPIGLCAAWIATAALVAPRVDSVAEQQAAAARAFLASLDAVQRKQAVADFDAAARTDWHFVPRERAGLALGELSDVQAQAARRLIASGLSDQGVRAFDDVVVLEQALLDLDRAHGVRDSIRDPGRFQLLIAGDPRAATWSWRIEGHHASIHFTHVDGETRTTPLFLGANPALLNEGPRAGLRVLGAKEDLARALAKMLSPEQRAQAGSAVAERGDVRYGPAATALDARPRGIAASSLDARQCDALMRLVAEHVHDLRDPLAEQQLARVRGELGALRFVWNGELDPGKPCYYSIESAAFAIEYDNTRDGANHAHCVWRDFERDLGRDLLGEHLRDEHAPPARAESVPARR